MRAIPLLTALLAAGLASQAYAAPTFYSTDLAGIAHWQVSTSFHADRSGDGLESSFTTSDFHPAVLLNWGGRKDTWVANNASGTNGGIGQWTFFVFRQTIDLTGYDAASTSVSFQWAADDSGQGYADRGTWLPKFRLNGGSLVPGDWTNNPEAVVSGKLTYQTYTYGNTMTVTGFKSGLNTLDFYVEGNGVTDGMSLKTVSFTTVPIPEPETYAMMLAGLGMVGAIARRRRK